MKVAMSVPRHEKPNAMTLRRIISRGCATSSRFAAFIVLNVKHGAIPWRAPRHCTIVPYSARTRRTVRHVLRRKRFGLPGCFDHNDKVIQLLLGEHTVDHTDNSVSSAALRGYTHFVIVFLGKPV